MKKYVTGFVMFALLTSVQSFAQYKQPDKQYKIASIDLMMLKRQKLGAIQLANQVGVEGLEVDMGGLGKRETFDNKLTVDSIRKQYIDKTNEFKIEICSLGMTGYYAQSFCERESFIPSIADCINTMKLLNVKVGFLPLGIQCDLVKKPELRDSVVSRLKVAGQMAKDDGVVIGIETALDAKDEKQLLKDVGYASIRSYFNFSNPLKNGRDLITELKTLGKKYIIQIHCTDDDGVLLKDNTRLDMKKVKTTLDKMKWHGWLVLERSRDAKEPNNVKKNFGANAAFMKSIFQ